MSVTAAGELYAWGWGEHGRCGHGDEKEQLLPRRIAALRGERVAACVAGSTHSLCALEDGRVLGWGHGEDEALGLQLQENQRTPLEYPALRVLSVPDQQFSEGESRNG